jgi:hypothetical protein
MADLPATDLRRTVLTLAVLSERLPAVGYQMRALLPAEEYDLGFEGQYLQTTYFDTVCFRLRKLRLRKNKYLTIRIRCYAPHRPPGASATGARRSYPEGAYALSFKTENGKYRMAIDSDLAESLLLHGIDGAENLPCLPADLLARYLELVGDHPLYPVATVCFTRFAVESTTDRLTLDTAIQASTGKVFPANVLEVKSTTAPYEALPEVRKWGYSPIKLSKFLWATGEFA